MTTRQLKEEHYSLLHRRAVAGSKPHLMALYEKTRGMWQRHSFVDPTGLLAYEDWIAIADQEFFESWTKWDESRGGFQTFMYMRVQNKWLNQLRHLTRSKRYGGEPNYDIEEAYAVCMPATDDGIVEKFHYHLVENDPKLARLMELLMVQKLAVKDIAAYFSNTKREVAELRDELRSEAIAFAGSIA